MKVHLRQIPEDGMHLEGEEDCPLPELAEQDVACAGPLRYALDLGISDNSLWANGTLAQPVKMTCVSCLTRFVHTIEVPAFGILVDLGGPEEVDLEPYVREDLLLNLPAHPHCDQHGGLVCRPPQLPTASPDEPRKPDWSALDQLDL